jgi:hypothetical protein
VIFNWVAPENGGSFITGYTVTLRLTDGISYTTETTYCDMTISTDTTCTIPVTVFRTAPFSFDWGTDIYANVFATNFYGDSTVSADGNGAMITTNPDAPINLIESYATRDPTTIGLVWSHATFTGGDVIIDYRINIAVQGGSFSILASGLTTPAYTAVGLTSGVIYEFKVESRNSYDYSAYSDVLTLLVAFKPDAPSAPTTTIVTNQVLVSWPDHLTNGSPITGY